MFEYTVTALGEDAGVAFRGDLDIDVTETMETDIEPELSRYRSIAIDFAGVAFVDSSGIGLLIRLVQSLQRQGRTVRLHRIRPEVMEIFDLLRLSDILGGDVFEAAAEQR